MTAAHEIQLGKKGITQELLGEIKKRFDINKFQNMKIHVLKSARENRDDVKRYAEEIKNYLGNKYTYRIIGFSIFFKKWKKAITKE
jgi:RNA-binding protein YhbY